MPTHDRETALIIDSVKYYNTELVPDLSPVALPFRRSHIPVEFWHLVPTIFKHALLVFVRTNQAGKAFSDPILQPDLVHYRGRSLTQLQGMLSDANQVAADPQGVALLSVLFLMGEYFETQFHLSISIN